jgi:hypothetical protein
MTLEDYARDFATYTHLRTMRRYLAWRVVTPANQNTRARLSPILPERADTRGVASVAPRLCDEGGR